MKLYVRNKAPNPRRVLIYLAEKAIAIPIEDVGGGRGDVVRRVQLFFHKFDAQLATSPSSPASALRSRTRRLSPSSISQLLGDELVPEDCPNLRRWHAELSKRPSARAGFS